MDIIDLHRYTVERYQEYIRSFIDIHDEDLKNEVAAQLDSGKLWPEPLIQFNPAYQAGTPVPSLIQEGVLHKEMDNVFSDFEIRIHSAKISTQGGRGIDVFYVSLQNKKILFEKLIHRVKEKIISAMMIKNPEDLD